METNPHETVRLPRLWRDHGESPELIRALVFQFPSLPTRSELATLADTEQLDLGRLRSSPTSSRKIVPPASSLEPAGPLAVRPGRLPSLVAEEFAFDEGVRQKRRS